MPYIGTSPSNGVRRVHTYTATASQTTFTGASSEGVTLSYADTNYIDVFQNGVLLGSADYTSTSGTSVVLAQGASADDLVVIVVYDVFSVADTVSKANGGTFDSAVTMSGGLRVADGGNIGSASDTDAIAISSGGVVTFSQTPVGAFISEADQFRLTANTTLGVNADITSNLERNDNANFSKIGTGMTESSGIFTFPSTGLYLVIANPMIRTNNDTNSYVIINVSIDSGSNFTQIVYINGGMGLSGEAISSVYGSTFINVTNTSTFQVKFTTGSFGGSTRLEGNTGVNYTSFTFIKLGESQ